MGIREDDGEENEGGYMVRRGIWEVKGKGNV